MTQPLNAISPIDSKFFELIIPIATFLTGTLSGIMLAGKDPEANKMALQAANKGWDKPPTPPAPSSGGMPPRPSIGGMVSGLAAGATGFGMSAGAPVMTRMPDLEPGDPTHRNFRND